MRIALATCRNLPDWEIDDRPLVDALMRRGIEVDHPAWDDESFDWAACDACLIRTTWDYQETREAFLRWVNRTAGQCALFNPPTVVRWNTHKSYLRDLERLGVPIAPTVWIDRGSAIDLAATCAEMGWLKGFLKPAIGSTARETLRFDATNGEQINGAQAHLQRMTIELDEDMLLQPYLESVETSGEISVVVIDGEVTHGVRKIPVPGDYRVQDDFGATDHPIVPAEELIEMTYRALEPRRHDLLYGRADYLKSDDRGGTWVLTELELVEPSLFFRHGPHAADRLAEALLRRLR